MVTEEDEGRGGGLFLDQVGGAEVSKKDGHGSRWPASAGPRCLPTGKEEKESRL